MRRTVVAVPALALALLVSGCSSGESFCDLVAQGRALEQTEEFQDATLQMSAAIANATSDTDPAAIAAIQDWGEILYDLELQVIPIYEDLLGTVDDPEILEGIQLTIDLTEEFGLPYAQQFSEATTLSEWQSILTALTNESAERLEEPGIEDALTRLDDYSIAQCGFPLSTEND
jgi:hypothetical protein